MTIGELKEEIEDIVRMSGEDILDTEIYAVSDYGDRSHTKQLVELGDLEFVSARKTAYSDSGLAVDKDGDSPTRVAVLSNHSY